MNTQLLGSYFDEMVHQDYGSKQFLITGLTFRSTWRGLEMDSFEERIVLIWRGLFLFFLQFFEYGCRLKYQLSDIHGEFGELCINK